jgi:hypothetical protein
VRDGPLLRGVLLSVVVAGGLGAAVALGVASRSLVVGGAMVLAHAILLPTPRGRPQPLSPAVAAAFVLTGWHSIPVLVCGAAMGFPIGWLLVRFRGGSGLDALLLPAEVAGLAAFAASYAVADAFIPHSLEDIWVHLLVLAGAGLTWHLAASAVRMRGTGTRGHRSAWSAFVVAFAGWPAPLVLVVVGALFGVAWDALGVWAAALAGPPYGFAHLAFVRLEATRTTYDQTIRALGQMPEAGGFTSRGHAERTADTAVAIGSELGFSSAETSRVEQAALLLDIGRVVLSDPAIAGGGGYTTRNLAQWSAAIIGEAPTLQPVAAIVGESHRAYRRPGEERDPGLPVAAQVLKVASAYHFAVDGGMEPVDALEVLHRGAAYEYDPDVIGALRRVLQRRGLPGA